MSLLGRLFSDESSPDEGDDTPVPGADAEEFEAVSPDLDIDDALGLLGNSRRRQVIKFVWSEPDGETTLDDLARHIAAEENDCAVSAVTGEQRKRVYVGLYQCHLPKLDDTGVVDWEKDRGTVEIATNCDPLAEALTQLESRLWGGEN